MVKRPSPSNDCGFSEGSAQQLCDVFVGRLSNGCTREKLHDLAKAYHCCGVKIYTRQGQQNSGFLQFDDPENARNFIAAFDQKDPFNSGVPLNVRFSDGKGQKLFFGGINI